jgi:hypothetical protein
LQLANKIKEKMEKLKMSLNFMFYWFLVVSGVAANGLRYAPTGYAGAGDGEAVRLEKC